VDLSAYPPYYWPPPAAYYPGGYFGAGLAWGLGVAAGPPSSVAQLGRRRRHINVNKATNIDRNYNRNNVGSGGKWQHDAGHPTGREL